MDQPEHVPKIRTSDLVALRFARAVGLIGWAFASLPPVGFVGGVALRFARALVELVFSLCEQFGIEVVIMNKSENSRFEDDLVQDVLEIITVFSARLYGARSRKNQKLLQALKQAVENV